MQAELFHRIAEPGSAEMRRLVEALGLGAQVRFRNVAFPEAARDLAAHGGGETPALWDGERLHTGSARVAAELRALQRAAG
ncbi:MAG TPA: hypothetical protein VEJ89_04840 [Myxococcaceae bacterium]|nr:hypothetical protein [Myxococcaceae bacterium]